MLETADRLFAKLWSYPLKFLCGMTGKSNYFFAKLALGISFVFYWISTLIDILKDSLGSDVFNFLLMTFITFFIFLPIIRLINLDEETDSNKDSETIHYSTLNNYVFLRVIGTTFPAVFFPTNTLVHSYNNMVGNCALALLAASIYFALDNRPGKKSWVKVGIEKLVEAVKKIHIPNPIPSPIPVPTS